MYLRGHEGGASARSQTARVHAPDEGRDTFEANTTGISGRLARVTASQPDARRPASPRAGPHEQPSKYGGLEGYGCASSNGCRSCKRTPKTFATWPPNATNSATCWANPSTRGRTFLMGQYAVESDLDATGCGGVWGRFNARRDSCTTRGQGVRAFGCSSEHRRRLGSRCV